MKKAFIVLFLFALHAFAQESEPKVIKAFAPEKYPPAAFAVRASGEIKVEVEIDKDGNVVSAKTNGGHPLLQPISISTAKKWKFSLQTDSTNSRFATLTFNFNTTNKDETIEKGNKATKFDFQSSFIPPYQMNFTRVETTLFPIIELLPRTNDIVEEKYCELHKVKMKTEIVDIIYGLTMPNEGFEDIYKAEEKLFPNANFNIGGGCIVEPTKKTEVYYCDKCRDAKTNWVKERKSKLGLKEVAKK